MLIDLALVLAAPNAGALLGHPVDPGAGQGIHVEVGRRVLAGQRRSADGQASQQPPVHRVQLADVAVGRDAAQEAAERGGCRTPRRTRLAVHTVVAQHVHVIDGVGAQRTVRGLNLLASSPVHPRHTLISGVRLRGGSANCTRGAASFLREQIGTARDAGVTGRLIARMDSSYYNARPSRRAVTWAPASRSRCGWTRACAAASPRSATASGPPSSTRTRSGTKTRRHGSLMPRSPRSATPRSPRTRPAPSPPG